jgi:type IV pilus assembly protein PilB
MATAATLEAALEQLGLITPEQLSAARLGAAQSGKTIDQVIEERKLVDEEDLVKAKAVVSSVSYVNLVGQAIKPETLSKIPLEVARNYRAVIFGVEEDHVNVALENPDNVQAISFIERKAGTRVVPYLASHQSVDYALHLYPAELSEDVQAAIKSIKDKGEKAPVALSDKEAVAGIIQDAPVTRAVNAILEFAVKARASDIHIEPREETVKVRYRIDGVLKESMTVPKTIHAALISRIKILSNLKIDEHRLPQDGRFKIVMDSREIDLRVSISPTVFGEKVVLRILDKSAGIITVEELGLRGRGLEIIRQGLAKPHGMTLVTGPTGSGKSTTLYAVLVKLNTPEVNIVTLEDPVEYHIEGINQIQVNPQIGLTFASGLRSILRQDPNIIMVGEIRDKETADLAVQSALTGHAVLSTLHTNSAAGALPRLLDMDVEPFLIASTVNTIIAQRLVRRICPHCIEAFPATETEVELVKRLVGDLLPKNSSEMGRVASELGYQKLPIATQDGFTLYRGKTCKACNGTGYLGREGIFEVFPVTESMEHLLLKHAASSEVQETALSEGMITMRQDGVLKVLNGETTMEEVARVAQD